VNGSFALILHAHLPFVRHPEQEWSYEETWLFEVITETYVPLLRMMKRLRADSVPFKLTLSVSPTLAAMLSDSLLRQRYIDHLERLIALATQECERNRPDENLLPLSEFYRDLFVRTRSVFIEEWNCDVLAIIRQLGDAGALELIATAATHAILPILERSPPAAQAQVAIGCDCYRESFGREPNGFWLPECAYSPGIENLLQEENIRWFVLDAHGLEQASPPARRGTFAPCFTPGGPAAFARDPDLSRQIWSAELGYPGDFDYRDFYRDIGFDLSRDDFASHSRMHGSFTGIKYYRVTGKHNSKELYVPVMAMEKARIHAQHFIELCCQRLTSVDSENALLLAPFDAELFGHWWFEGPIFLEHVIRFAAENKLPLVTPGDYLRQNSTLQIVRPAASSWGEKGYFDVWLDEKCAWIYAHLAAANERMVALANRHAVKASIEQERALQQLARELLLAQASDWPFHIRNGTAREYAARRIQDHLGRFNRLATSLEHGRIEPDFLVDCEDTDNLFSDVNWREFCGVSFRTESRLQRSRRRPASPGFPSLAHPDKGLEMFEPTRLRSSQDAT
jgi:1,4-alpha-glucan branching enzyme